MLKPYQVRGMLPALCVALFLAGCGGGGGGSSGGGKGSVVKGFRVVASTPRNGAISVSIDSTIQITFSSPVRPDSVDTENVLLSLRATGQKVAGTVQVSQGNLLVEFTPEKPLLLNTGYRIRVLEDVLSSTGVALGEAWEATFTSSVTGGGGTPNPPPPTIGKILLVGNMLVGRSSHTATLLADGRVLIAGGFADANAVTGTAEIYDGTNFTFTYVPQNMSFSRAFHTATLLGDGTVLILGGITGGSLAESNAAEIYDPATRQFTTLVPGMVYSRAFHTATLLADGRVLILGGTVPISQGVYSSRRAEVYDPVNRTFTALPDMWAYRAGHTATRLDDGRVLVLGGNSVDLTIELFDPKQGDFVLSDQTLFRARRGHTATYLPSTGDVVVNGGGSRTAGIWVARDSLYRWTSGIPIEDRTDHSASVTASGRILFAGGSREEGPRLLFSQTTEQYDRFSGAFLSTAPLLGAPTCRHRATVLKSGNILITGGSNVDPKLPELRAALIYTESDD